MGGEGAADTPPYREGAMRAALLALSIVCYVLLRSPQLLWAVSSLADLRGSHMLWLIPYVEIARVRSPRIATVRMRWWCNCALFLEVVGVGRGADALLEFGLEAEIHSVR